MPGGQPDQKGEVGVTQENGSTGGSLGAHRLPVTPPMVVAGRHRGRGRTLTVYPGEPAQGFLHGVASRPERRQEFFGLNQGPDGGPVARLAGQARTPRSWEFWGRGLRRVCWGRR